MSSTVDRNRPFSSLSKNPDHPHSVWENPEPATINPLGRLALITPELVKQAASEEIQTGERFSLDLSIENEGFTLFGRKKAERTVKRIDRCAKSKEETEKNGELWFPKHDDLLHINTQVSSISRVASFSLFVELTLLYSPFLSAIYRARLNGTDRITYRTREAATSMGERQSKTLNQET